MNLLYYNVAWTWKYTAMCIIMIEGGLTTVSPEAEDIKPINDDTQNPEWRKHFITQVNFNVKKLTGKWMTLMS